MAVKSDVSAGDNGSFDGLRSSDLSKTHEEHGISREGYIEDQRKFFDSLVSKDWEDYINEDWDRARQEEVDQILSRAPSVERVLDLGCGCGYHDLLFAKKERIRKIVAVDYSEKSIEKAESEYPHAKIERHVVDFLRDKEFILSRGPFDLVACFQVIEHLTRPDELVAVSALFAKVGGHVAIVTPNEKRLQNRWLRMTGKPVEMVDPLHFREYGIPELRQLGQKWGLKAVSYFGRDFHLSHGSRGIITSKGMLGSWVASMVPTFCDVIGVIFRK